MVFNPRENRNTPGPDREPDRATEFSQNRSSTDQALIELCQRSGQTETISIGVPFDDSIPSDTSDACLTWCPGGLPNGTSLLIASSRLNQKFDQQSDWFDALRTIAVQLVGEDQFLVTSSGTTTDLFVRRIGELFGIPVVSLVRFPENPTSHWFVEATRSSEYPANPLHRIMYFKPLCSTNGNTSFPTIDELLIASATSVVLLAVRNNGNVLRSAQQRMRNSRFPDLRLLINRRLTPHRVESKLLENGATAWWIYDDPRHLSQGVSGESSKSRRPDHQIILNLDELKTENYLIHWTRRRVGPWPDQSSNEFLDDLIFHSNRCKHDEVAALCRILASRRIIGSSELTRDRRPVVCLSDVPLEELPHRRIFRPHLSRWDFEPYGIAIDRDLIERLDGQPVVYGTASDWDSLADHERPFFQLAQSTSKKIDWKIEKEWRILGDLRLELVAHDQAFVFVKFRSDADAIADLSPWPIVVLFPDDRSLEASGDRSLGPLSRAREK